MLDSSACVQAQESEAWFACLLWPWDLVNHFDSAN